jgi:hypothetical protein
MFIHRYNNEIVPKSGQQIGYAIELPSQYMLKYLSHHIQLLGRFSTGTSVSSSNKTDRHDITEILLKVTLIIITIYPS